MLRILLLLVVEHLRHRPIRALLTVLGVAIGVSAWLAIRVVNGEVYRFNLMSRLRVRNVAQLLRQAIALKIIPKGPSLTKV